MIAQWQSFNSNRYGEVIVRNLPPSTHIHNCKIEGFKMLAEVCASIFSSNIAQPTHILPWSTHVTAPALPTLHPHSQEHSCEKTLTLCYSSDRETDQWTDGQTNQPTQQVLKLCICKQIKMSSYNFYHSSRRRNLISQCPLTALQISMHYLSKIAFSLADMMLSSGC